MVASSSTTPHERRRDRSASRSRMRRGPKGLTPTAGRWCARTRARSTRCRSATRTASVTSSGRRTATAASCRRRSGRSRCRPMAPRSPVRSARFSATKRGIRTGGGRSSFARRWSHVYSVSLRRPRCNSSGVAARASCSARGSATRAIPSRGQRRRKCPRPGSIVTTPQAHVLLYTLPSKDFEYVGLQGLRTRSPVPMAGPSTAARPSRTVALPAGGRRGQPRPSQTLHRRSARPDLRGRGTRRPHQRRSAGGWAAPAARASAAPRRPRSRARRSISRHRCVLRINHGGAQRPCRFRNRESLALTVERAAPTGTQDR